MESSLNSNCFATLLDVVGVVGVVGGREVGGGLLEEGEKEGGFLVLEGEEKDDLPLAMSLSLAACSLLTILRI